MLYKTFAKLYCQENGLDYSQLCRDNKLKNKIRKEYYKLYPKKDDIEAQLPDGAAYWLLK